MDWNWSDALIPLLVAALGAGAVAIGAGIASTSALRVRLIDMVREEEKDRQAFHVRVVAAVNRLGTASAALNRARLAALNARLNEARRLAASGEQPGQIMIPGGLISPTEDARVATATDEWRAVLAEAHVFASEETGAAMRAFDEQRAALVTAENNAVVIPDLLLAIRAMESAGSIGDDLRSTHAKRIYRALNAEKRNGAAKVFHMAYVGRPGKLAKQIYDLHRDTEAERRAATDTEAAD